MFLLRMSVKIDKLSSLREMALHFQKIADDCGSYGIHIKYL